MIQSLQINNFKCFQQSPIFNFSKVNLLTGINGRGKSSLLQSLLILSQSASRSRGMEKLIINGGFVDLGNYDDIKNSDTPRSENIVFDLTFSDGIFEKIVIEYKENERDQLTAELADIMFTLSMPDEEHDNEARLSCFTNILSRIHYVSADRLGPVRYVDKINLPEFINVGAKGEFTINILAQNDLELVHENLYLGNDARTVLQQTEEWLKFILDGAKIEIRGKESESSVLYMLLNNRSSSYNYKPGNMGFGYSYILPLLVTGLIAKEGDVIIIENPEAHLHPRAQSRIVEFFSRVASCGIQVFIESHSEHILNGLRVSVLRPDVLINSSDVAIHYFEESFDVKNLSVDPKGKIANWPEGFFDQQEIDLASIFRYNL